MKLTTIAGAVAVVAMCWTLSACSTTVRYKNTGSVEQGKQHGPPPHAPAHGYRHKHGDTVLVFDSTLEVYLVKGHSNYYFDDKHYYRSIRSGGWERTTHLDGPWKAVSTKKLPKGLRNSELVKNDKKKKKK